MGGSVDSGEVNDAELPEIQKTCSLFFVLIVLLRLLLGRKDFHGMAYLPRGRRRDLQRHDQYSRRQHRRRDPPASATSGLERYRRLLQDISGHEEGFSSHSSGDQEIEQAIPCDNGAANGQGLRNPVGHGKPWNKPSKSAGCPGPPCPRSFFRGPS